MVGRTPHGGQVAAAVLPLLRGDELRCRGGRGDDRIPRWFRRRRRRSVHPLRRGTSRAPEQGDRPTPVRDFFRGGAAKRVSKSAVYYFPGQRRFHRFPQEIGFPDSGRRPRGRQRKRPSRLRRRRQRQGRLREGVLKRRPSFYALAGVALLVVALFLRQRRRPIMHPPPLTFLFENPVVEFFVGVELLIGRLSP